MTLKSLFQKRNSRYQKELLKYTRYIFNDHFTLILFLLIGAGGYAYSNFLETVTYGMIEPRLLLVFLFFVLASTGSVTTLLEAADQMFLLPKEDEFYPILKRMIAKSYVQSLLSVALLAFITFPIFAVTIHATTWDGVFIFLVLASLKWLNLLLKIYPYFYQNNEEFQKYKWVIHGITLLSIVSMAFIHIKLTALILTGLAFFSVYLLNSGKIFFDHLLKWDVMIEAEERRLQRMYRVIQMFVNVPHMETRIRRLMGLDKALDWLSTRYQEAPYYYLLRTVARNTEYSLLILRVTMIGSVLLIVTDAYMLSILLMVLFLYIIGFQFISLATDIDRLPQFQIYPIAPKIKVDSVLLIIFQILTVVSFFLTIGSTVSLGLLGLTLLPLGILFAYLFSYFYVPKRLKSKIEHTVS